MLSIRILGVLLVLVATAVRPGEALAADAKPAQGYTFEGVIDAISRADSRIVLKSTALKTPKTADVKVDAATQVTINKKPAAFGDLVEGDKAWVLFAEGIAKKVAVTRDAAPAPADK